VATGIIARFVWVLLPFIPFECNIVIIVTFTNDKFLRAMADMVENYMDQRGQR